MYFFVTYAMSFYRNAGAWAGRSYSDRPVVFCLTAAAVVYVTLFGVPLLLSPILEREVVFWLLAVAWFAVVGPAQHLAKADKNGDAETAGFIMTGILVVTIGFLLYRIDFDA